MRIALVTQEEPFYLPPALDAFCRARQPDIVALIVLPSFNETLSSTAKRLYEFYGTADFARLTTRYVWARLANTANRIIRVTRPYSAKDVGRRYRIRCYSPPDINGHPFIRTLRDEIRPDLLVSLAASQIVKKEVLQIPSLGCINLHSAPLPRYQGMMPNFWTMLSGEPEAAVTVHYMDEKLDSGDIILQRPVPIHSSDSLSELMVRSKLIGVTALLDAVKQIEDGSVSRKAMDSELASYFSFPRRADAQRLRQMGRSLI